MNKKTIKIPSLNSLTNSPDGSKIFIYEKYDRKIHQSHCFVKHGEKWREYKGHTFCFSHMRDYLETLRDVAPYLYKIELKKI